jgi:hypothetical protein
MNSDLFELPSASRIRLSIRDNTDIIINIISISCNKLFVQHKAKHFPFDHKGGSKGRFLVHSDPSLQSAYVGVTEHCNH